MFFGNVLGVKGDNEQSTIKCSNCKASLTVKRDTLRVSTLLSDKKRAAAPSTDDDDSSA